MSSQQKEVYLGIDFHPDDIQISYCRQGMREPETVSLGLGEEKYRISTEEITSEILGEIIKSVPELMDFSEIRALTFHLKEMNLSKVKQIQEIITEIGIPKKSVWIQDTKEAFCHFAMNQKEELTKHDMVLFVCHETQVLCYYLRKSIEKQVEIQAVKLGNLPENQEDEKERDIVFGEMVTKLLAGRMVSSIYLLGKGFEGGWLQESLKLLCQGRRAFHVKNLLAKGACYASVMEIYPEECDYVLQGEYRINRNVFLQVRNGERRFYKELALAGHKYYELGGSCEVLLQGDSSIDVWLQVPGSEKAKVENLKLTDLPKRPGKATRLKIELLSGKEGEIILKVTDLGFGQWYPASGKVWEYCINE